MSDQNALVPGIVTDEAAAIADYAGYGGPDTHDTSPVGVPILRWRHMGANTATAVGGKFYNSLEGDDRAYDEIPCIILDGKNSRAYYQTAYDPKAAKVGNLNPPDCKSNDGSIGVGNPGGECKVCPHSQWGANGAPPACALSYDRLIVDFHTGQLGIMSFARTKIKAIQEFHKSIRARNGGTIPMWAYKVIIRSERRENYHVPKIDIEGVVLKSEALKYLELKNEANAAFLRTGVSENPVPNASIDNLTDDVDATSAASAY